MRCEFLGVNVRILGREDGCPPPVTVCRKASPNRDGSNAFCPHVYWLDVSSGSVVAASQALAMAGHTSRALFLSFSFFSLFLMGELGLCHVTADRPRREAVPLDAGGAPRLIGAAQPPAARGLRYMQCEVRAPRGRRRAKQHEHGGAPAACARCPCSRRGARRAPLRRRGGAEPRSRRRSRPRVPRSSGAAA